MRRTGDENLLSLNSCSIISPDIDEVIVQVHFQGVVEDIRGDHNAGECRQ